MAALRATNVSAAGQGLDPEEILHTEPGRDIDWSTVTLTYKF